MDNRIFISIASYRDQELWQTLNSLITQAKDASQLHIAICWQDDNDLERIIKAGWTPVEVSSIDQFPIYHLEGSPALIELIAVPFQQAEGAGFARFLCDRLYRNEQWFFQIDAHSLLAKHWDSLLIEAITSLRQHSEKPLISGYPPAYYYTEEGAVVQAEQANRITFNAFNPGGLPTMGNRLLNSDEPLRGSFLAAGFIFTQGSFVTEVGNDPNIFFEGEEITLSLRAFSWGYDTYYHPMLVLWHHYTREDSPKIWNDHSQSAQEAGEVPLAWMYREIRSQQYVRGILGLSSTYEYKEDDKSLGPLRTLRQFEYQCGLDIQLASCYAECMAPNFRSYFPPPINESAWSEAHCIIHAQQINVSELIGPILPDKLSVHLYGHNMPRLAKFDFLPSQVIAQSGNVNVEYSSTPNRPPALIRLASWSITSGWGVIIEWPWSKEDGPYCLL